MGVRGAVISFCAFIVAAGTVAVAWLKQNHTRKKETDPEPDHGRKRRASFEEDRNIKRHETGEVAIHAAATGLPVTMVGSVPDMTANWAAKVAVNEETQRDPDELARAYTNMAQQIFLDGGLNLPAIEAQRQFYDDLDSTHPTPLRYEAFKVPLEKGAVRLGILRPPPALCKAASKAASAIEAVLPPGFKPHATAPESMHITIFMTSQPADPRPDPFNEFGGGQSRTLAEGRIPAPKPEVLAAEKDAFRTLATQTSAPILEVHSIVFAASGTLLLCCVDTSGVLAGLRTKIRKVFPGGPVKQSSIFHVTLLRVLEPQPMKREQLEAIHNACQQETERLKGTQFTASSLWHVQEWQFTTVQGELEEMPFAEARSSS
ncbi:hypothetical protein WJX75_002804 [Coccomyxa subellipsoidea]|uniref:Protein kinase A anchor protein nuclear localisation signal domain-containing protein n=1 Tax=Coccomyxa subellipsoidea TaxID=248742 RepID=A0ABR2YHH0_9CHLO